MMTDNHNAKGLEKLRFLEENIFYVFMFLILLGF